MKLSIVIPAHNEEHRLPVMLEAYAAFFSSQYHEDVELIVVPNFCDDDTVDVARKIGLRFPQITVLDDPGHVGKGGAVMLGAEMAQGDLIGFVDADGATPPEAFNDLVEKIGSAGCIIASRWMKGSLVSPEQSFLRQVASRSFNLMVRCLFGLRLTDTQCGAKVFRCEVMRDVMQNLGVTNWAFDVDMLFQVKRSGATVREIPTVWRDRPGSKIQAFKSPLGMTAALVRLRMYYSPLRSVAQWLGRWLIRLHRKVHTR